MLMALQNSESWFTKEMAQAFLLARARLVIDLLLNDNHIDAAKHGWDLKRILEQEYDWSQKKLVLESVAEVAKGMLLNNVEIPASGLRRIAGRFVVQEVIGRGLMSLGGYFEDFPWQLNFLPAAGGFGACLPQLVTLDLSSQKITSVEPTKNDGDKDADKGKSAIRIKFERSRSLCRLKTLVLHDCDRLLSLAPSLGRLPITSLGLSRCPRLTTPPAEVVRAGVQATLNFLRRLSEGSARVFRTKLMLVGLGGAGKTSLVRALLAKSNRVPDATPPPDITDGILIQDWVVSANIVGEGTRLHFSVWDFAGQSVYYHSHQFFLSNRAVYLLVWNGRLGFEHAGLVFWLSSIAAHAPTAPVFVVATRADMVFHNDLPEEELRRLFPQIQGFFRINVHEPKDVGKLAGAIIDKAGKDKKLYNHVPRVWLDLEQFLLEQRKTKQVATFKEVKKNTTLGFYDPMELRRALDFFHQLGSLQYWASPGLRDRIVLDPQWLLESIAALVSVKEGQVREGRFRRDQIHLIWPKEEPKLREWLLRLTEEFDLSFRAVGGESSVNIMPCLLPESAPASETAWPPVEGTGRREMKMTYTFAFLPSGLFNRLQVRLCQYADSSAIWKKGARLSKGDHLALIRQGVEREVLVWVQGPAPANLLFLIHEVIEKLIREFFAGAAYDVGVPCVDCVKAGSSEPFLFSSGQIRRAEDMKVPFLQCGKVFTLAPLSELLKLLPPSDPEELRKRLGAMLAELDDIRLGVGEQVLMLRCGSGAAEEWEAEAEALARRESKRVGELGLGRKRADGRGLKSEDLEALMEKASAAAFVLVFASKHFLDSHACADALLMLQSNVGGGVVPVLGGSWPSTSEGVELRKRLLQDKSAVHLTAADGPAKLRRRIRDWLQKSSTNIALQMETIDVLISFAGADVGTAEDSDSAEPKDVFTRLVSAGHSVWADPMVQSGSGGRSPCSFEMFSEAARRAAAAVVCVSDGYLACPRAMMEFRSLAGLKKPLVLADLGGREWQRSEISFTALSAPRASLPRRGGLAGDEKRRNDLAQLANLVQEQLSSVASSSADAAQATDEASVASYIELTQFTQRKFLQQLDEVWSGLAEEGLEALASPRPRVMAIDSVAAVDGAAPDINTDSLQLAYVCEFEQAMHMTSERYPLKAAENSDLHLPVLVQVSSYLLLILKMARHQPHLNLRLEDFRDNHGAPVPKGLEKYLELLEGAAGDVTLRSAAAAVVRLAAEADPQGAFGGLRLCRLQSRRELWLCGQHQSVAKDLLARGEDDAAETAPEAPPPRPEVETGVVYDDPVGGGFRPTSPAPKPPPSRPKSKLCIIL